MRGYHTQKNEELNRKGRRKNRALRRLDEQRSARRKHIVPNTANQKTLHANGREREEQTIIQQETTKLQELNLMITFKVNGFNSPTKKIQAS